MLIFLLAQPRRIHSLCQLHVGSFFFFPLPQSRDPGEEIILTRRRHKRRWYHLSQTLQLVMELTFQWSLSSLFCWRKGCKSCWCLLLSDCVTIDFLGLSSCRGHVSSQWCLKTVLPTCLKDWLLPGAA